MMTHAISAHIERQAEAQAFQIEEAIRSNEARKEYVTRVLADAGVEICRQLDDSNATLAKLAASIRSGDAVMPVATTLPENAVNTEAVFFPPKLAPPPTEEETEQHREAA